MFKYEMIYSIRTFSCILNPYSDRNSLLLELKGAPAGVSNEMRWNQSISDVERQILHKMYSDKNENSKYGVFQKSKTIFEAS